MCAMVEELLERVVREIRERKRALQAAVDESARLERALAALGSEVRATSPPPDRGSRRRRRASRRRTRAARGANRDAILALVRERPGVSAGEIAQVTGIARSTVSPTLARLAGAGAIGRVELPGGGVGYRSLDESAPGAAARESGKRDASSARVPG
jgi:DNA-binding transcriptional ArsR family regulator